MTTHTLDIASYRAMFGEFANVTTYPDATIQLYWDMATAYISNADYLLAGAQLQMALNLMTAHLMRSMAMLAKGQDTVVVTGSTEGSVSVSLQPPPVKSGWQWWLATTGYGAQLRALLGVAGAGGYLMGGAPERSAFRKAGGVF